MVERATHKAGTGPDDRQELLQKLQESLSDKVEELRHAKIEGDQESEEEIQGEIDDIKERVEDLSLDRNFAYEEELKAILALVNGQGVIPAQALRDALKDAQHPDLVHEYLAKHDIPIHDPNDPMAPDLEKVQALTRQGFSISNAYAIATDEKYSSATNEYRLNLTRTDNPTPQAPSPQTDSPAPQLDNAPLGPTHNS